MMQKKTSPLLWGLIPAAGAATLFGLIPPVVYGIWNIGVVALLGLAGLLWGSVWAVTCPRFPRWLRRTLWALLALTALGSAAFSLPMAHQAWGNAPDPALPCVILVPGARIYGDRPSLMLSYRLRRAAELGALHEESVFVVSGGQASGDEYSEAEVMADYLAELGISPQRIYLEDRSTDTEQNMRYAAEVIAQNGLTGQLTVSTDAFHQLRSRVLAEEAGLAPVFAVSGKTPWGLAPCYWVREFFGLAHHFVFERGLAS